MRYSALVISYFLLIPSCDKNSQTGVENYTTITPVAPPDDSIDVNSDNVVDYVISSTEWSTDDIGSSAGYIRRSIQGIGENKFLHRSLYCLNVNDTIRKTDPDFDIYPANLILIRRQFQYWEKVWKIDSGYENATNYFIGFKMATDDSVQIGWLLFNFDSENGKIFIIEKEISNADELIIQK